MSSPVFVLRARRLRAARGVLVAKNVSLTASPGDVVALEGAERPGEDHAARRSRRAAAAALLASRVRQT